MNKHILVTLYLLIILLFSSCEKNYDLIHSKSRWINDYFEELESTRYPQIYAISWWNEDFDNSFLTINSSGSSCKAYQQNIQNDLFISNGKFVNHKLVPIAGAIYHGAYPNFGGTEDNVSKEEIVDFELNATKKIAWAYFSNNWDSVLRFPTNAVQTIAEMGKIPFIRLMPRSEFETGKPDPKWQLIDIVNGVHDKAIIQWALGAKMCNCDILVEFGTEVNGNWFPWNGEYNGKDGTNNYGDVQYPDGPEVFRDAYRHIINLCKQQQATNITWFFHIDASGEPNEWWNEASLYYPGDDYIDWIGVSTYGPQNRLDSYETPQALLQRAYKMMQTVSTTKPYAILEFGVTEL